MLLKIPRREFLSSC